MASPRSGMLTFLLLAILGYVLQERAPKATGSFEKLMEEDMEFERHLRAVNKTARESFKTEFGDIMDCVDIYKQPAFDHPLLKDHKIQFKPEKIIEGDREETPFRTSLLYVPKIKKCPEGTVPIVRATKEDLLVAELLPNYLAKVSPWMKHEETRGRLSAVQLFHGQNYGASAAMSVWLPFVLPDQISGAFISIVNGLDLPGQLNNIQAGWMVNPYLYKNYSRLFTFWTADNYQKTGCYNVLCPGFLQVSTEIPLGLVLSPVSEVGGTQHEIALKIYQDKVSGNWWLRFGDRDVGYWPGSVFTTMKHGASDVAWGGVVYSPTTEQSPPMGSGFFPHKGPNKAAYMAQLLYSNRKNNFHDPLNSTLSLFVDRPKCYKAAGGASIEMGHYVYYGGPGRCLG